MNRLDIKGISKKFKSRQVVNSVSFKIESGQIVGLLGPNGAGKTTSFYMVVGLLQPDTGDIEVDGANISQMPMYQRARAGPISGDEEPGMPRGERMCARATEPPAQR